jgi:tetratricopeptide (TPR) repeat protein
MRRPPLPLALLLLALSVPGAAAVRVERRVERSGCGDLVQSTGHEFAEAEIDGAPAWVDLDARAWRLGEPALHRREGDAWASDERYRVGDGAVRVRIMLAPRSGRFAAEVLPQPAGDFALALAQYLPGIELPCRAEGRIAVAPMKGSGRSPASAATVHALIRRATEQLYDQHFADAEEALREAQGLAPRSDTLRWMRARVAYLEGESLPAEDRADRLAAFARAERFADEAVELAPDHGEGWLWRGIARGRITTTQAGLRRAIDVLRGERGPAWVADCFERAIALRPEYVHFGFSAAGDARAGAAQLYRLLPDGAWARRVLGVERDVDRAIVLAREALTLQPTRIEYAKELGVALLCRAETDASRRAEAERVLRAAQSLPARTPYELTDRRHARQLLTSPPAAACSYSRDAWEANQLVAGVTR